MKIKEEMTKAQFSLTVLLDGLMYAFVEVLLFAVFAFQKVTGDGLIWAPLLWTSFILAALWVITTMSDEAHEEARDFVLNRDLFMSDFIISAAVLCGLALISAPQGWHFAGMFLVAAGQNLRYTYESMQWLIEDYRERERRKADSTDNNLP